MLEMVKWAGIGALGMGVTTQVPSGLEYVEAVWRSSIETPIVTSVDASPAHASMGPGPSSVVLNAPTAEVREPSPSQDKLRSQAVVTPPVVGTPSQAHSLPSPSEPQSAFETPHGVRLKAEVALLERGRTALRHAAPAQALQLLAGYEERFPERQLVVEVLVLRMEAAHALGQFAVARKLAQRVLSVNGGAPYAARAQAILSAANALK
jgi:hypothetical protein